MFKLDLTYCLEPNWIRLIFNWFLTFTWKCFICKRGSSYHPLEFSAKIYRCGKRRVFLLIHLFVSHSIYFFHTPLIYDIYGCGRRRVFLYLRLLHTIYSCMRIHFLMWEGGAPRVGTPWEIHAPLYFLFRGDTPYRF